MLLLTAKPNQSFSSTFTEENKYRSGVRGVHTRVTTTSLYTVSGCPTVSHDH